MHHEERERHPHQCYLQTMEKPHPLKARPRPLLIGPSELRVQSARSYPPILRMSAVRLEAR